MLELQSQSQIDQLLHKYIVPPAQVVHLKSILLSILE